MTSRPAIHVLIPTHTTRHLAACLAGLSWQSVLPASVVVTCDTDDAAIGELVREIWPRVIAVAGNKHGAAARSMRLLYVYRRHQGVARLAQVRNNGLRALSGAGERDLVVGIDGDIVLSPMAIEKHAELAASGAELILGQRVCLEKESTEDVTADGILQGVDLQVMAPAKELESLAERHARYERQWAVRRMLPRWAVGMVMKPHKPKVIGAHYAATVGRLKEVNGFDEEYVGYGCEDDDFGRRLHAVGVRVGVGVKTITAYHLWHPTRAPSRATESPGYARFARKDLPVAARHGWMNPLPQPDAVVREISGA